MTCLGASLCAPGVYMMFVGFILKFGTKCMTPQAKNKIPLCSKLHTELSGTSSLEQYLLLFLSTFLFARHTKVAERAFNSVAASRWLPEECTRLTCAIEMAHGANCRAFRSSNVGPEKHARQAQNSWRPLTSLWVQNTWRPLASFWQASWKHTLVAWHKMGWSRRILGNFTLLVL